MIKGRVGMIIAVVSVEYTQTHISMHISFGSIAVYSEAAFDISLLFPYFFRSSAFSCADFNFSNQKTCIFCIKFSILNATVPFRISEKRR